MHAAQSSVAATPSTVAALFDLDDTSERFMAETMLRFHGEYPGLYTAIAMKRFRNAQHERVVLEVARFQPQRRGARPRWMVIAWNSDEVSIRFHDKLSRRAALTAYAATGPAPLSAGASATRSKLLIANHP